jgi:hypothetical protein
LPSATFKVATTPIATFFSQYRFAQQANRPKASAQRAVNATYTWVSQAHFNDAASKVGTL